MSIVVYAPASIGNMGVGFDLLGAALSPVDGSLLGDQIKIKRGEQPFSLNCCGVYAHKLPEKFEENLVYFCYLTYKNALQEKAHQILPVALTLQKNLPVGSGLGSSSSSIVAALHALNTFHDNLLTKNEMLLLMGEMEGIVSGSVHYDNVAPCYLGGTQLMINEAEIIAQAIPSFSEWYWVISYPGISISTAEARDILPKQVSLKDTLSYGRHLATYIHACHTKQSSLATKVLKDVIAEPYRATLIPNFEEVKAAAQNEGCHAMGISGSGPTIFAVFSNLSQANSLQSWLNKHFLQNNDGFTHICKIDTQGARTKGTDL